MRRGSCFGIAPVSFGAGVLVVVVLSLGWGWAPCAAAVAPKPPPACPVSFDTEAIPTLIENIKAVGENNWSAAWTAGCSSKALARKGEDIIPALISLMDSHQRAVEQFAIEAVCGPGHTGATAVPYIEQRLRDGGLAFAVLAYPTLACIGEGAVSTIPLLLSKSLSINLSFPAEAALATETLGSLYQYDARIIPHLRRLLDQPMHTNAAANALEKIGRPARSAEEALRRNLAIAVDASRDDTAVSLIAALGTVGTPQPTVSALVPVLDLYRPRLTAAAARALARFGPQAAPAVPALIRRLSAADAGSQERADDVAALIAIDRSTPAVLKAILDEMTREIDPLADESTAATLAKVDPFPSELAAPLIAAIEMRDPDSNARRLLEQALAHTRTDLKPEVIPKPAPTDVSDRLGAALWALTQQPRAIVLDDLVQRLHMDPNEYLNEGQPGYFTFTRKLSPGQPSPTASLVKSVKFTGLGRDIGPPVKQVVDIVLDAGSCVSAEGIRAKIATQAPADTGAAVAETTDRNAVQSLRVEGDHSTNKSTARESELELEPGCAAAVKIIKLFDPDYWNAVCPFTYDHAFIESSVMPTVQSQFGNQFGNFDLEAPEIHDYGPVIAVSYNEARPELPRRPWQGLRLSLEVDRCSHAISNVSRYVP